MMVPGYRVLIVLIISFLAACSTQDSPTSTVSFMVFGDPAERQAYVDLVGAFHEQHPDIRVTLRHVPSPSDYRTRLATDFAAGSPPDVSLMNYRRFAAFAANDLLQPLGPYLELSALIAAGDFFAVTVDSFMWQGQLMCIPQNISSLVVYYNADLFEEAGLPFPADDWTWDMFVQTARGLTRDFDGDGLVDQYGLGLEPSLFRLAPFVWQNEAPLVDDEENPKRLTLTRPPSLEALQWFINLRQEHGVVPTRVEEAAQDSESRFIAGTTAMFLNSRRGTPTYREIEAFTWDVAPLPKGKVAAGILHSDAYCMSAMTHDKESAWTFIEYANSVDGQTRLAASGRTVPSLRSVAESTAFLDPAQPPERAQVWLDTVPTLRRVPVIGTWEEIERTASLEIERAFYGDISARESATLAFQRTEEYFVLAQSASRP